MLKIKDIILPTRKVYVRKPSTHEWLEKTPVKDWPPITVRGKKLIDGMQRVMFALEYQINEIPYIDREIK